MQNQASGLNFPVHALDFQKMEIRDRFTCTQCSGAFFGWVVTYRCGLLDELLEKPFLRNSGQTERKRPDREGVFWRIACKGRERTINFA